MRVLSQTISQVRRRFGTFVFACLAVLPMMLLPFSRLSAQDAPAIIGRIEGSDIAVKTATSGGVEVDAGPTVVASGSDVTVHTGSALLLLDGGGEISICGPAHFTLLKSAGAVTIALDYGRVHPSLDLPESLTIYTPMIVATPVAIAGARRDTTVGLNQSGSMCILTTQGAMRVEQQLSGQSLLVPQGGNISLVGGQVESLRADPSSCACDYPRAGVEKQRTSPSRPSASQEVSTLNHPREPDPEKPEAAPQAAPAQEPVYTVLMPPLSFDASSPSSPPDPSPETILLVREERMRPSVVFHGHVNPAPVETAVLPEHASPPAAVQTEHATNNRAPESKPGVLTRIRNFFRRMGS